jgi:hypothetical protein
MVCKPSAIQKMRVFRHYRAAASSLHFLSFLSVQGIPSPLAYPVSRPGVALAPNGNRGKCFHVKRSGIYPCRQSSHLWCQ